MEKIRHAKSQEVQSADQKFQQNFEKWEKDREE